MWDDCSVSVLVSKLTKARLCLKTAREYGVKTHAFKHFSTNSASNKFVLLFLMFANRMGTVWGILYKC